MVYYSHAGVLYAKWHYAEISSTDSGHTSTPKDFSLAMLDMDNSQFRDSHRSEYLANEPLACHFSPDCTTKIHDNTLITDITNYRDPQSAKDTCGNATTSLDRTRQIKVTTDKTHPHPGQAKVRIVSIFDGSYNERNTSGDMMEVDGPSDVGFPEPHSVRKWAAAYYSNGTTCYDVLSDSDTANHRNSPKTFSFDQRWHAPTHLPTSITRISDGANDIPALSPGFASSPESMSIDTPVQSPGAVRVADIDCEDEADALELPEFSDVSKGFPVYWQSSYTVLSNSLIISSKGSDMGKVCRPVPKGFQCSCYRSTGTMGDMTRHWQSRFHSHAEFECTTCGKTYTRIDALKRHMRRNGECLKGNRKLGKYRM